MIRYPVWLHGVLAIGMLALPAPGLAADDDGDSMATGVGLIAGAFFGGVGAIAGVLFGPKRTDTTHLDCAAP